MDRVYRLDMCGDNEIMIVDYSTDVLLSILSTLFMQNKRELF